MRAFFRFLGRILTNRWFLTILGLIAISLLIWFVGPLIAIAEYEPLASETVRLIVIMVLILLWAIQSMFYIAKSQKTNNKVVEDILDSPQDDDDNYNHQVDSESQILKERMNEALTILKTSKLHKKQKLYQLPWYIMIGPPGSGKTTALINSGLNFPLADKFGKDAIHGIGGTRNCDWWFTDQAVLIDTAGRYTTQDSHAETDSKGWANFMELLKKHRPRRPINGAVIAISMTDLLTQTETERNIQARAIRKRLNELNQQLGMTFPTYIMFTKADLVAGFLEFFDDLSRSEREQIWGMTFSMQDEKLPEGSVGRFREEFDILIKRANERLVTRLQQERDPKRRALIYEFPKQLKSLQKAAEMFLREIFAPNKFQEKAVLRGVYLASGTQVGTPIDRIMNSMARSFGMNQQSAQPHMSAARSFFLTRIFQEVIFPEADLASTNRKFDRQRRWLLVGAYTIFFTFLSLGALGWINSYRENSNFIDDVKTDIKGYNEFTGQKLDQNTDPRTMIEALTKLRDFPAGYEFQVTEQDHSWTMGLGLYQGEKLGEEAGSTYLRGIQRYFIRYMKSELEYLVKDAKGNHDYLYEALKTYLMLYNEDKMKKEDFKSWLIYHWENRFPGIKNEPLRKQLEQHLDVALANKLRVPPMDEQLVQNARFELSRIPLAQTLYRQLKQEATRNESKNDFKLNEVLGFEAANYFSRRSGKPLFEGIPEFYTYNGFYKIYKIQSIKLAKKYTDEIWIYGEDAIASFDAESEESLKSEVENLYFKDYIAQWKGVLNDLQIIHFTNPEQGAELLSYLNGPNAPINNLLLAVKKNTELSKTFDLSGKGIPSGVAPRSIDNKLTRVKSRLDRVMPKDKSKMSLSISVGKQVEQAFIKINNFTENKYSGNRSLTSYLSIIDNLGLYVDSLSMSENFSEAAYNASRGQMGGEGSVIKQAKRASRQVPKPLNSWLIQLAEDSSALTTAGAKSQINNIWQTDVKDEFDNSLKGRYPLDRNASVEATMNDFGNFFGYGGTMERFFNTHLKPFVDTSRSPWKWKKDIGLSRRSLVQFERAERIKELFFEKGSNVPNVEFSLKPLYLDNHVSQFLLEINGQTISYRHGPIRANDMIWPGNKIDGVVRIVFTPPDGGRPTSLSKSGAWGWFKMLDAMQVDSTSSSNIYEITFEIHGSKAKYELKANSVENPFSIQDLELFECPTKL